ncbi:ATP-binding protein [Ferruginibacter paludis]|uniref:AAA family ATPase n=1 Tax=Ferruginibacter paludis TaxID=1310417 RepID=UPI0025B503B0|nr:ATP-binding protein [Ferruginibacter paludis]MDN3656167.1 ATP-binding protein [Ferruginibacter paludis]
MAAQKITGRENELQILENLLHAKEAELLAIYGRRRVGKTFLIKNFYGPQMIFSCTGLLNGTTKAQLFNFSRQLESWFPDKKIAFAPATWQEAFLQLKDCIVSVKHNNKKVIFFDELPWLESHKSNFLSFFGYFWNNFAVSRPDIIVVICGSAASWIIDKVVNNKGGLHNRITQRIRLLPFTLKETQAYLQHRNIHLEHYQLLQLYMVMGGIPAYLNGIQRGKSAAQNIETICFSKDGVLTNEFDNLYAALFNSAEKHVQVIQALAKKHKGLTRSELLLAARLVTGGRITTVLTELTESGFIEKTYPFAKKEKESLYRLSDEFSLFYFKFMYKQPAVEKGQWLARQSTPSYVSWCGYAFESICLKHVQQIKMAMQIGGLQTKGVSWLKTGTGSVSGAQIDLLIDRADHMINICEIKFSAHPYTITKKYAAELRNKIMSFRQETKTTRQLVLTFITTYGLADNIYKEQLVEQEVTMEALFI